MPKGIPIQPDEIQHILDLFNDCRKKGRTLMESYTIAGAQVGRDAKVIAGIIQRLRPTTDLARMYFRAKSLKMAKRIVKKGSPAELIDILQRPSVGVLDPVKKVDVGPGGFFLSVSTESCGAVKVGMAQLPPTLDQPPRLGEGEDPPVFDPFADTFDMKGEDHESYGDAESRPIESEAQPAETVIERVRRQLAERRQSVGTRD